MRRSPARRKTSRRRRRNPSRVGRGAKGIVRNIKGLAIDAGWFLGGRASKNLVIQQLGKFGVTSKFASLVSAAKLSSSQAEGLLQLIYGAVIASYGPKRGMVGKIAHWSSIAAATDGVSAIVKPYLGGAGNLLGEMADDTPGLFGLGDWETVEPALDLGDWETADDYDLLGDWEVADEDMDLMQAY